MKNCYLRTDIVVTRPVFRYFVVHLLVNVEVEWLESVKDKVSHVFVHVCPKDTSIEVIDGTTSVHHLQIKAPREM